MPNSEKRHHLTVFQGRTDDPPPGPSVRCADGQITGVLRLPACALLQQAIDGVRDSIAILGRDYRFVAVNRTYQETFRRTHGRDVAPGMSFLNLLSHVPEQRERAASLWGRALGGETVSVTEHFGDERHGKKRFLEITYSPILDEDGHVVAAMDCCRDVTDRLVSEAALLNSNVELERRVTDRTAALAESENQLRLTLESAKLGTWVVEGGGATLSWSPRSCAIFGLAHQPQITLRRWLALVHPDDRERVAALFERVVQPGAGAFRDEFRCTWPGGSTRWVVARGETHFVDGGGPGAFRIYGTFADVTDRKQAEDERERLEASLHQAAKMGAIGQLAGGIAHDFNNLLTVILSGVEALQCGMQDTAADPDLVSDISAAAERARDLTSRLLAFARRQPITPRVIDVNALVRDGERLLRRVISPRVAIRTRLEESLGRVHCDPGQLEQVILNLAVNARDAMPAGGELHIETANADVDLIQACRHPWVRAGAFVRVTIRDTGIGMSAEVREHLFEPFFTTKPAGRGTGLGLAIVHGIVKQNAGFVNVESAPGEGTRFDLFLPRIS